MIVFYDTLQEARKTLAGHTELIWQDGPIRKDGLNANDSEELGTCLETRTSRHGENE